MYQTTKKPLPAWAGLIYPGEVVQVVKGAMVRNWATVQVQWLCTRNAWPYRAGWLKHC